MKRKTNVRFLLISLLILFLISGCKSSSSDNDKVADSPDAPPAVDDPIGNLDCNADENGVAYFDNCGICVGGDTGLIACNVDCNDDIGGTAYLDNCGICVDGDTGLIACNADCNGDENGLAYLDNCNVCVDGNTGKIADTQICHDFTELPLTATGWTDLEELVRPDSRIVYVSSSSGDNGTGISYPPTSPEIESNPFEPPGVIRPFASFGAAFQELRDGYPDILLFKRGDTWNNNPLIQVDKSGRSKTERLIIGAYGSTGTRPKLMPSTLSFYIEASNLIISDIELTPMSRDPDGTSYNGVSWETSSDDVLFEGCYIHNFRSNVVIQSREGMGNPVITTPCFRRNVIVDAWGGLSHGQGFYTYQMSTLLIEENIFDHNGWEETHKLQNVYDRSMYIDRTTGVIVRGNIDARGSSGGAQLRDGGEYSYNLSLQNPIAIAMGHSQTLYDFTGVVKYNVILDARDINTSGRGVGIAVGNRSVGTDVFENIIAHQVSGTNTIFALGVSDEIDMAYQEGPEDTWPDVYCRNTIFNNNIVYKWNLNGSWKNDNWNVKIGQSADGLTFTNNDIQDPDGFDSMKYLDGTISNGPIIDGWIMSGNRYLWGTNTLPFEKRVSGTSTDLTFEQWLASTTETGSTEVAVTYTDPERTIESYATVQGLSPADYEDGLQKFLTEARLQSRWNWRDEYTAINVINYIREGFDRGPISLY